MSNTKANINERALNMFFDRFYEANRSQFKGSGKFEDLGIAWEFELASPPYLDLAGPGEQPGEVVARCNQFNVRVFDLKDGEQGDVASTDTYKLELTGTTAVTAGALYLNLQKGKVTGGGDERILTRIINRTVIPSFNAIQLPKFWEILSRYIPINLERIGRLDGEMTAELRLNNTRDEGGFMPPPLNPGASQLGISIGQGVIESVARQLANIPGHFRESTEVDIKIAGARITLDIYLEDLYLSMEDGSARISLKISPRSNLNLWTLISSMDFPFNIPSTTATGSLVLRQNGNEIWIGALLESLQFEVRPNLPPPFNVLEKAIGEAILNLLSGPVTELIRQAFGRIYFKLFELPRQFPGTPVPATFDLDLLDFRPYCVQSRLQIS